MYIKSENSRINVGNFYVGLSPTTQSASADKHFNREEKIIMLNKEIQRNFRMTQAENNKLHSNAKKANLSVSSYLRMLINDYIPKECPPLKYDELMAQLNDIYDMLLSNPQIAIEEFRGLLLQIQAEITLPERIINHGCNKVMENKRIYRQSD